MHLPCAGDYVASQLHKMVLDREMYLKHYSKALVYSDQAQATLVLPDRKPLPSLAAEAQV